MQVRVPVEKSHTQTTGPTTGASYHPEFRVPLAQTLTQLFMPANNLGAAEAEGVKPASRRGGMTATPATANLVLGLVSGSVAAQDHPTTKRRLCEPTFANGQNAQKSK